MKKHFIVLTIILSFALQSFAFTNEATITEAEREMAKAITAEQLSDYLHFVASDAMGGRNTPSAGLDITAQFIALNLKKWGFKPAGDKGSYFQKMMVRKESMNRSEMAVGFGGKNYKYAADFYRANGSGKAEGPLVFAKDGWMVKSKGIDAYKGVDVKGKIVVLYTSRFQNSITPPRPDGVTDADIGGKKGVDWDNPMGYARSKGAIGVIVVASERLENFWPRLGRFLGGGGTSIEGLGRGGTGESNIPVMLINRKTAGELFDGESADFNSKNAFDLKKTAMINAASTVERIPTQNVVALWEGSDPTLKQEMVAIGAHYDHVGTRPNARGDDKIWNGADDDGSGTVAMIAMAEALAKTNSRPKRSLLFVWHAGEEKGLLGAAYFNKYPTVDIKKVVAQLNIDMIGRSKKAGDTNPRNKDLSGPNEVYVIGSGMMSSKLEEVTKGTNKSYMNMKYNLKYDDPKDTNRFFFRSDHFHYAQNGIPIVFWFTGTHQDYHGAGDHADKIDYQKMEKISRTIFLTMWKVAELNERPAVDKKLPPELTRRG